MVISIKGGWHEHRPFYRFGDLKAQQQEQITGDWGHFQVFWEQHILTICRLDTETRWGYIAGRLRIQRPSKLRLHRWQLKQIIQHICQDFLPTNTLTGSYLYTYVTTSNYIMETTFIVSSWWCEINTISFVSLWLKDTAAKCESVHRAFISFICASLSDADSPCLSFHPSTLTESNVGPAYSGFCFHLCQDICQQILFMEKFFKPFSEPLRHGCTSCLAVMNYETVRNKLRHACNLTRHCSQTHGRQKSEGMCGTCIRSYPSK